VLKARHAILVIGNSGTEYNYFFKCILLFFTILDNNAHGW